MAASPKVFLDTSALFSAVYSETGGARLILKLGESGVVALWVGPWVLREAESVLDRKSPESKGAFVLLLDRSGIQVGVQPDEANLHRAHSVISHGPDAQVVAEALEVEADFFVSFDRKHLEGNPKARELPFPIGTAGDFLAWYRQRVLETGDSSNPR